MMRARYSATLSSIILAISVLPTLIEGYDCRNLEVYANRDKCPTFQGSTVPGPMVLYPMCLVSELSVSAFIQCADVRGPDAPTFGTTRGGDAKQVTVLELLKEAVVIPACSNCRLAKNIQDAANRHGPNPNFAEYLCDQFHPVNAEMCCLKECLHGIQPEHSIEAFCSRRFQDLTTAPLIQNCPSNAVAVSPTDDESISSDGVSGSDDPSATRSSTDDEDPSSDDDPSSSAVAESSIDKPSSARSFTVPTTSPTAAIGTTSPSSSSPETEGTPNAGADSGRLAIHTDRVKRLAFVVLPIIAAF
ncbi:MAG: hypothetical protein LQ339_008911 [Xanthoria mediterranea]|nr:MAG: hypothetical protein LQ339_008911 [Xanthoria mediterranea]